MPELFFPPFASALFEYARNTFSQNGEDGMIEEILRRLGIVGGWVVESGAWDGVHLSNTFALVQRGGFRGLHIEADQAKFVDLVATAERVGGAIVPVNATLESDTDTLGDIMSRHCLGNGAGASEVVDGAGVSDVAVLSIDIDSHDYHVWKNLSPVHSPAVVVIEINSGVSPVDWKVHGEDGWALGTSFLPMLLLGVEKGYSLVAHTGNMIFVRNDVFPKLGMPLANPFSLFWTRWL
jgi:hypothetical protein